MVSEIKCVNCNHEMCRAPECVVVPHCIASVCDCHETRCIFLAATPLIFAALRAALNERDSLQVQMRAGHSVFGTSQLTHARARLETAEAEIASLREQRDSLIATLETRAEQETEMIKGICEENDLYREALTKLACFDDKGASDHFDATGGYAFFDEPCSVEIARKAIAAREVQQDDQKQNPGKG